MYCNVQIYVFFFSSYAERFQRDVQSGGAERREQAPAPTTHPGEENGFLCQLLAQLPSPLTPQIQGGTYACSSSHEPPCRKKITESKYPLFQLSRESVIVSFTKKHTLYLGNR